MSISGYKSVSRVDHEKKKQYGWFVRVLFRGVKRSKFFSDKNYESRETSLQAAVEWRNATERELGKPRTDRLVIGHNPRNKSGISGIERSTKVNKRAKGEQKVRNFFKVSWCPEPGKGTHAWISIDKYGEEIALRKAIALRREKEREMFGEIIESNWDDILQILCGEKKIPTKEEVEAEKEKAKTSKAMKAEQADVV
ncbi:MAG: hypothetical protein H7Z37_07740 [Pyrinomonadaceae bacterium]|nr:hypothetical protein [Pyrinomonadaceae bacterium]